MCEFSVGDQTRTGHILGEAYRRSEAPERQMSSAQSGILRLLNHLAMLQGTIKNYQVRPDQYLKLTSSSWNRHHKKPVLGSTLITSGQYLKELSTVEMGIKPLCRLS